MTMDMTMEMNGTGMDGVQPQAQAYFTGSYVRNMRDLYVASLVSGMNSVSLGGPGWGKTNMALSLLDEVMPGRYAMVRIHPATMPEEVKGAVNTAVLLSESRVEYEVTGTPFDLNNRAVVVDEFGRANRVIAGLLMQLLDRKDTAFPAPILATSNFMPNSPETEALLDRIALWYWVDEGTLDVEGMVRAQMTANNHSLRLPGKLPTLAEIETVWRAQPGPRAIAAVAKVLNSLAANALQEGLRVHPRRLWQWQRLLYRYAVYVTGDPDFDKVPNEALRMLRFAWPCHSADEAAHWQGIVSLSVDAVSLLVEAYEARVVDFINGYIRANKGQAGAYDALRHAQEVIVPVTEMQKSPEFQEILQLDPEAADACAKKTVGWAYRAMAGKEIDPLANE